MISSLQQSLIIVAMVTVGTALTRFLPFILFPDNRETPQYIRYLGKVLPFAVIGLLIVYCLKSVSVLSAPYGIPEGIAIGCIVLFQLWKSNTFLSIGGGTVLYMILVQFVFI